MLLSHTSGFNIHGFADYAPDAPLPTLIQTLNGERPAMNKPLSRIDPAGTRSRYSGGGYMIAQAVIEDATGERFDSVARRLMFDPLGMQRSRFEASPDQHTRTLPMRIIGAVRSLPCRAAGRAFPNSLRPVCGLPPAISRA